MTKMLVLMIVAMLIVDLFTLRLFAMMEINVLMTIVIIRKDVKSMSIIAMIIMPVLKIAATLN
jgi:hypothetical protein